ncbi:MAG: GtrA family protein [Verrucomicrobia bacterium]|nr:GtrA family protein [Verrucomicrobiota bacterium]MDA1087143.1 GtrA family protein [Verrucomicrobiota bacterium]
MKKLLARYTDPQVLKQFLQQDADRDIQFFKYAIAGATATAFHIVLFHLIAWKVFPALQAEDLFSKLLGLTIEPLEDAVRSRNSMYSNLGAFIFSNFFCWIINRAWVFNPGRHHIMVELGLFYVASSAAIGSGTLLMGWLISHYGMITTLAFCANLVTSLLINYGMRKFVIFKG